MPNISRPFAVTVTACISISEGISLAILCVTFVPPPYQCNCSKTVNNFLPSTFILYFDLRSTATLIQYLLQPILALTNSCCDQYLSRSNTYFNPILISTDSCLDLYLSQLILDPINNLFQSNTFTSITLTKCRSAKYSQQSSRCSSPSSQWSIHSSATQSTTQFLTTTTNTNMATGAATCQSGNFSHSS